jgi:hypothetical protein
MLNLFLGIVIGAAFSKFWISLWEMGKARISTYVAEKDSKKE